MTKRDKELLGTTDDLGIEVEEIDLRGEVDDEAVHRYAMREGAPPEAVMEKEDTSSVDPHRPEVDKNMEDLEGQSIFDGLARNPDPLEVQIPVDAIVEEPDVLLNRWNEPIPMPERLSDKPATDVMRNPK